jgi:hypothetical protein
MKKIIKLKLILKKLFPKLYKILKILFNKDMNNIKFSGWGLTTEQKPPWLGNDDLYVNKEFLMTKEKIKSLIVHKKFNLTQFTNEPHINTINEILTQLNELDYRHYIVNFSALYAKQNASSTNLVECGVCDGLTVYFAMNIFKKDFHAYLYDSWQAMREKDIADEKKNLGKYFYLDIENTKENLEEYENNVSYMVGYIPEIFVTEKKHPDNISWLHIDLNASMPTLETLNFFFPKLCKDGVILFDDYGWDGYESTRKVADTFLKDKKGDFLHFPTGQAMFIKK